MQHFKEIWKENYFTMRILSIGHLFEHPEKFLRIQLKVSLLLTILQLIIMGAANLLKSIELLNLIIFYFLIKDEEKWEGRHSGAQLINTPLILWGIITALEWSGRTNIPFKILSIYHVVLNFLITYYFECPFWFL